MEDLLKIEYTNNISGLLLNPFMVKITISESNKLVTKNRYISYLVGTSETTRTSRFNEWLAGLIDGDGSLLISKKGNPSCEITVNLYDEKMLRIIQNQLGGNIKSRSGVKAVRWRLHNNNGIIDLIQRINGNIRNTNRLKQLHHLCSKLNLPIINPIPLTLNNNWFAGYFDADGTISYSFKNNNPQLYIGVTNKLLQDVEHFNLLGGKIYYDRTQQGCYKWQIHSQEEIEKFTKLIISFSHKSHRLKLIPQFYYLKSLKSYSYDISSANYKNWLKFENKWKS